MDGAGSNFACVSWGYLLPQREKGLERGKRGVASCMCFMGGGGGVFVGF